MRLKIENELLLLGFSVILLGIIVFLIPLPELLPMRAILTLIFMFFAPGYSLLAIFAPRKNDLTNIERLIISVGISFTGVSFFWLLFNYTPWGITLQTMFFPLMAVVLLLIYIAWQRRKKIPINERFMIEFTVNIPKNNPDKFLSVLLVASVIIGFASMGYSIFSPVVEEKTTEFYILGATGIAADYPRDFVGGLGTNVTVGIINNEGKNTDYRVVCSINEYTTGGEWFVSLMDGENIEKDVKIIPPLINEDTNMKIEFDLYLVGNPTPYRNVYFWSDIHAPMSNFTSFYFAKEPDTFLGSIEIGRPVSVKLGIYNYEHKTMTYMIDLSLEFPISEPVQFEVTLNHGETVEKELTFTTLTPLFYPKKMVFNLRDMGHPQNVYKQLRIDFTTEKP